MFVLERRRMSLTHFKILSTARAHLHDAVVVLFDDAALAAARAAQRRAACGRFLRRSGSSRSGSSSSSSGGGVGLIAILVCDALGVAARGVLCPQARHDRVVVVFNFGRHRRVADMSVTRHGRSSSSCCGLVDAACSPPLLHTPVALWFDCQKTRQSRHQGVSVHAQIYETNI
jgi:hypothetical protein